jgi:glycosyltransferase involved in cell wall biosynthesis
MLTRTMPPVLFSTPWRVRAQPTALWVGSYPPRECGIATFTEDIRGAYDAQTKTPSDVIAITDPDKTYAYPACVIGEIQRDHVASYAQAARLANAHSAEVVNLQHEYGLFGGTWGHMLIEFMSHVRKPIVTTLHTVLPDPDAQLRHVTREICNRSDAVIVLAAAGRVLLDKYYGIDPRRVRIVLHGVPDVPLRHSRHFKRPLGLQGKTVLSTFGLLSRGKGIEYVIEALPAIFARDPNAFYVLLGETHPEVRRHEGEAYRESLWRRVCELGIQDRVRFDDHYMSDQEVVARLLATDVYVSPSLDPHQIVSGTLSYAIGCGRAVVATASAYARELLADGRGIVVPFRDAAAVADGVNRIVSDKGFRQSMEVAAYRFGRRMIWPRVAREYQDAFTVAIREQLVVRKAARVAAGAALLREAGLSARPQATAAD